MCNSLKCKYCNSDKIKKLGFVYNKQRYYCKDCGRTFREGVDNRIKYDDLQRMRVIKMYLEGIGIRSIERLENISNVLILKWIKRMGNNIKEMLDRVKNNIADNIKKEDIEILEVDEIVTYIKKNSKTEEKASGYGFLLTLPSVVSSIADRQAKMIWQANHFSASCLTETGIKLLIFK